MKATVSADLQLLLQDFYNLMGIKTCLFDSEGNELCYYPPMHSRFCALLRRDAAMEIFKSAFAESPTAYRRRRRTKE